MDECGDNKKFNKKKLSREKIKSMKRLRIDEEGWMEKRMDER